MAASMNKVILIGRLGQDPKLSYTQGGQAVANFTMATDEGYKDRNSGQRVEKTEWHRIVCWRQTAEFVGNYLSKGRLVLVEGKLQTRKWQDQNGQDRYTTEIVGNEMQMLGGRDDSMGGPSAGQSSGFRDRNTGGGARQPQAAAEPQGAPEFEDDDIPF